jgi:2-polyprenyl-3-methyl-5-hydroxy-6-metoxy-1,4-benzoquinol methylase
MLYDTRLTSCPVCGGPDVSDGAIVSTAGFLSVAGVGHSGCAACGSYFVNPQPSADSLEGFYRSVATEDFVEDNILRRSLDRYLNPEARTYFIANRVLPLERYLAAGSRVIDVGCGAGVFVRVMRDRGHHPRGIDLSERSVQLGREKLDLAAELSVEHWRDLGPELHDAVTAWTLIEHLKDPEGFVRKAGDVLAPGGLLLLECPTVDSLLFRHLRENFFWVMPFYHLFLFSRRGMRALLDRCGFELLEEYNMPRNWYFVASVCRSLSLDVDELSKGTRWGEVVRRIDEIFDDIALERGESSTVQFIARRR